MKPLIKWITKKSVYGPNSKIGQVGKYIFFSIHWDMFVEDKNLRYKLTSILPDLNELGNYETIESAAQYAETIFSEWLFNAGLKVNHDE